MLSVTTALGSSDLLGEGPWWDDRSGLLNRVDIKRNTVHSWDPDSGGTHARTLPDEVSIALPTSSGHRVVAQVDRLFIDDGSRLEPLCAIDPANQHTQLNDGTCDPDGNLWVGTYSTRGQPEAGLYVVRPDGDTTQVLDGLRASNGIGWNPNGRDRVVLYAVDTGKSVIDRFGVRPDRGLEHLGPLCEIDPAHGRPDGITVDQEGFVWAALWGGGRIRRYAPSGDLDLEIPVPVTFPTAVTFGGADLATLYATTSRYHLDDAASEPLAGNVLALTPGVRGVPVRRFGQ